MGLLNVHTGVKGRHEEDGARLFLKASSARTRGRGHQLQHQRIHLNIPNLF